MNNVIKYIIKREYKLFLISLIGYIILLISLRYLNLTKEIIGGFRALMISRFVIFLLTLIFIERLSLYIPKGIYYKDSEYISYIPYKASTIFNAIVILILLGITIFHGVNYYFLSTTYEELLLALVAMLTLTFLTNFLMYVISLIIKKKVMVSIVVLLLGSFISILIATVVNNIVDYFNNFDLTVISFMIMLFNIGYYGLCKCITNKGEETFQYKVITASIGLLSLFIYISGQYL